MGKRVSLTLYFPWVDIVSERSVPFFRFGASLRDGPVSLGLVRPTSFGRVTMRAGVTSSVAWVDG